ncbi:MAG TPA: efflux RND transporter periplasmic adaptor subunit [Burkholderiales bacterium]|nr:efflux RND transporter periplasmic adaptor subunit [Burkholderiales bacterium]
MRSIPILAPLLALVVAACSPSNGSDKKGGGHPGMGMPAPEVNVMTVEPKALPVTFEYVGQTAGSREVEVRARVTGILLKRNFSEGEPVKRGQSLFSIDPAPYEATMARAQADVGAAEARLEQAKRNAARLKPLYAEKAVSQKDYDDAVSGEAIGAADLKAARARLSEARLNLGYTKVEAPVSGVASRALRSEGSLVSGPDVLLTTVMQVDPIWVNFGIPDNDQARLQKDLQAGRVAMPGDGHFEVALVLPDGSQYGQTGKLNFSDIRISPATGTRESRAEIPNPERTLRPGQFVRVQLRGAQVPNAVTVPQRAVLEGPKGKFVYLVNEQSQAEIRPVEAGEWSGDTWIITSGLKAGDRVITDGVMKLGPGAPVRVADPNAKPPAGAGGKPSAKMEAKKSADGK